MMRIRVTTIALAAGLAGFTAAGCGDEAGGAPVRGEPEATNRPATSVTTVASSTEAVPFNAESRGDSSPSPAPTAARTPAPANVSYEEAETVYRSGNYGEAADLFEAYATGRPENPWGHYMLGIAAWKAGDHGRAEAALRSTLEVAPDHEKALVNLARVLLEDGKASDALEPAERVVVLDSTSGPAWRVLGNVRSDLGMVDEAVSAYEEALAIDHGDAWTMNNLGLLMIREGRYVEALPALARATELRPDVAVFQNNLGVALERSGHPTEAAEAFRAALAADPEYGKAQVSLDRVEAHVPTSTPEPVDLAELARSFADRVAAETPVEPDAGAQPLGTPVQPEGDR